MYDRLSGQGSGRTEDDSGLKFKAAVFFWSAEGGFDINNRFIFTDGEIVRCFAMVMS